MTFEELEAEVVRLAALVDKNSEEEIKYRRSYEDMMYNLSYENMPAVKKQAQKTATELSAVSDAVDGMTESISKIEQTVDEQGAEIALIVIKGSEGSSINAASIITAINKAGSSIKLSADKIQFEGSDITFDTKMLKVNSGNGCVEFVSPLSTEELYATRGYFQGKVDLGSFDGLTGYAYINCGELNELELFGDGGIVLSTNSENGDPSGNVEVYADSINLNGNAVLTRSNADIAYLKSKLGL